MDKTKLKRDNHSKAVLNTDTASYKKHRYEVKRTREIEKTHQEIDQLKSDVSEIKHMLRILLDGNNKNG